MQLCCYLFWNCYIAERKPLPHPGDGRFPRPGVKELPSLYFSNWFFLPSLSMGSFLFEVLFWISFQLALRLLWFLFFLAAFGIKSLMAIWISLSTPLGLYSRVTTKVPAAPPPPVGGLLEHTVCCLSLLLALHDLTASSHQFFPFYVYIFYACHDPHLKRRPQLRWRRLSWVQWLNTHP